MLTAARAEHADEAFRLRAGFLAQLLEAEPHPRVAEIGLVIAYPDRMPRRAIDDDDLDLIGPGAEFLKPASGTYSGPKIGETSTPFGGARFTMFKTLDAAAVKVRL